VRFVSVAARDVLDEPDEAVPKVGVGVRTTMGIVDDLMGAITQAPREVRTSY